MAVQLRDTYPMGTAGGGTCYICKLPPRRVAGGGRELVVDTGQAIDFEGLLMICTACVVEMAHLVGMVTAVAAEAAIDVAAEMAADAERARAERDEAKLLTRLVVDYRTDELAHGPVSVTTDISDGDRDLPAVPAPMTEPARKTNTRRAKATA